MQFSTCVLLHIVQLFSHTPREATLCAAKSPRILPHLLTPTLTIHSDTKTGITFTEPEILVEKNGTGIVRSLKVEMGPYGEPVRVTAELLPTEVLLMLKNVRLNFVADGQEVAAIRLKDGTEIRFD